MSVTNNNQLVSVVALYITDDEIEENVDSVIIGDRSP